MDRPLYPLLVCATAVSLLLLAGGCADQPLAPPAALSESALSVAGPTDGRLPIVIVDASANVPARSSGALVTNFADALARVAPGGTIRVRAGTYTVHNQVIDRAVTIEADRADQRPVIRNDAATASFMVTDVAAGEVRFSGLDFLNAQFFGIYASGTYDQVVVSDCDFENTRPGGTTAGVFAGPSSSAGARVLVVGSRFSGGAMGAFAHAAPRFDVEQSEFRGHGFSALQYQIGSAGRAEGNDVRECGSQCVRLSGVASVEVVGNTLRTRASRGTQRGIFAFPMAGHEVLLEDNDIAGEGGSGTNYGFRESGISAGGQGRTIVRGNTIVDGNRGIMFTAAGGGVIEDNSITFCGAECLLVAMSPGGSAVDVRGNTLRTTKDRQTRFGINASAPSGAGRLTITDNALIGEGVPSDPADYRAYAWDASAIQVSAWAPGATGQPVGETVTVSRNHIRNAHQGIIPFHGGVIAGTDNVIELTHQPVKAWDHGRLVLERSDITGYQISINMDTTTPTSIAATCNWWGSAGGPSNVGAGVDASVYTPWASAPIANTGRSC